MAVGWAWPRGLGAKPQVVAEGLVWVSASPEKQLLCTTLPDPGSPPGHFFGFHQGNCWRSRQGT